MGEEGCGDDRAGRDATDRLQLLCTRRERPLDALLPLSATERVIVVEDKARSRSKKEPSVCFSGMGDEGAIGVVFFLEKESILSHSSEFVSSKLPTEVSVQSVADLLVDVDDESNSFPRLPSSE